MNKGKILNLIKEITLKEMARIPLLFQLSSMDQSEIDAKIPEDLKRSSVVQNILKYFQDNQNAPASTATVAKYWGYPSQQAVNTQFQRLRAAGVLSDQGFAAAKKEKPLEPGIQGRPLTSVNDREDPDKIKYVINKFKKGEDPAPEYKEWFFSTHGKDAYSQLKDLIDQYKASLTKEDAIKIKGSIMKLLTGLGMSFAKRGRKPMERIPVKNNEPTIDTGNEEMYEQHPSIKPGIAKPITRPEIRPKRRTLTPPDPSIKPSPKNENIINKITQRFIKGK